MCSKEILANDVKRLCQEVRRYVSGQVEIWRKIPWLALEAHGRAGSSYECSFAFRQGVWGLSTSIRASDYSVYVDLRSGELIDVMAFHEKKILSPASDDLIFPLANMAHKIDAAAIRLTMERRIQQKQSAQYDEAALDVWRAEIREQYQLKVPYDETCLRDMNDLYYGD